MSHVFGIAGRVCLGVLSLFLAFFIGGYVGITIAPGSPLVGWREPLSGKIGCSVAILLAAVVLRRYLLRSFGLAVLCLFATEVADPKKPGRIKRVYRPGDAMTPLDKLASLPAVAKYLRKGVTLEELQQLARALSDVQAAQELSDARAELFRRVPARA